MNNIMINDQRDAFESLLTMFERLIDEADDELLMLLNSSRTEEIYITAPSLILKYFQGAIVWKFGFGEWQRGQLGKLFVFRGITMYPSSDWAITLYHKDYTLYKMDWMIRKISLDHPRKVKGEWYTEYVVKLVDLFQIKSEDSELN
jgi:hypothetical protein